MYSKEKSEILFSEKALFNIKVPYKLIETSQTDEKKPLIVYLHGFNDHIESFLKTCKPFLDRIEAYHLFIQAPYPLYDRSHKKKVEEWGRAWYLYDGDQEQFLNSLAKTSELIDEVLTTLENKVSVERLCVLGYSMGGYLAGYYALTRYHLVNDLIVAGARIKTEVLNENWGLIKDLQVLAIHGKGDNKVDYKPQRTEIVRLSKNGINANFKLINQKHIFNVAYIKEACDWLVEKGYSRNKYALKH
ncbi:alpha/beta hydrolase [Rhodohalobacter sp. 614A]|uniref:alpha/beta hydrolase n=1 Tax=Rhodohalobacter sp. 614A TaxID=2908649 RepID=UPI001F256B48|nr:alpha/beta hydrolase [Rhodohalobacter sp. 614A]